MSDEAPGTPDYDPATRPSLARRYRRTRRFMLEAVQPPGRVLDLGPENPLSGLLEKDGFVVQNTEGDLDERPAAASAPADVVTAFEILEHLVSPMPLLRAISAPTLIATVPLRLWFAPAYQNADDQWDRHYHEFEDWQFDWLLEKSGWQIVRSEKWTSPTGWLGIRPLLRRITPRYYAVHAERREP